MTIKTFSRKSIKRKSVNKKSVKRKTRKSIKRKSVKRKSTKRKSIKRKSVKRKSIKGKSSKRKSINKKQLGGLQILTDINGEERTINFVLARPHDRFIIQPHHEHQHDYNFVERDFFNFLAEGYYQMTGTNIFSGLRHLNRSQLKGFTLNLRYSGKTINKSDQELLNILTSNEPDGHYDLKEFIRSYLIPLGIFEKIVQFSLSTINESRLVGLLQRYEDYTAKRGNRIDQKDTQSEIYALINDMKKIIETKKEEREGLVINDSNFPSLVKEEPLQPDRAENNTADLSLVEDEVDPPSNSTTAVKTTSKKIRRKSRNKRKNNN